MSAETQPSKEQAPARKLAGKYDTQEALERGYLDQNRETQRIIAEKRAMEEQLRVYQTLIDKATAQTDGSAEALEQAGVPTDMIERIVAAKTAEQVEALLSPLLRSAEAVAEFEDQGAASRFLRENPEIQATFNRVVPGDPQGAARLVELEMENSRLRSANAEADAGHKEVISRVEDARRDAGVPKSGSMSREAPAAESDTERARINALAAEARTPQGGVIAQRAYLNERLKGIRMWLPGEDTPRVV